MSKVAHNERKGIGGIVDHTQLISQVADTYLSGRATDRDCLVVQAANKATKQIALKVNRS